MEELRQAWSTIDKDGFILGQFDTEAEAREYAAKRDSERVDRSPHGIRIDIDYRAFVNKFHD